MAHDDWRLRIELDDDAAGGLLESMRTLESDGHELAGEKLAVTHEGRTVFVYADSSRQIEKARTAIDAEVGRLGIHTDRMVTEHWLTDEDRWDDEPAPESVEDEALDAGYAPWEVRIPCGSHHEAQALADRLEAEGYGVVRRFHLVIAGTETEDEAKELAAKLHGEVEPGGELVWEVAPGNPWAVFGGLGSAGTPF
jgi:hypothetical protein